MHSFNKKQNAEIYFDSNTKTRVGQPPRAHASPRLVFAIQDISSVPVYSIITLI